MDTITLWTRQVAEMLDELERTGCYRVREEYIRKKNDDIADYYLKIYRWLTQKSRAYIEIPPEAEFPVWFSTSDSMRLRQTEGTVVLKLEVPRKNVLLVDSMKWDYRGNNMYVPVDEEDRRRFERELKHCGVADETSLAESEKGNFYPLLKREILNSWDRVFTIPPEKIEDCFAVAWEVKREWLREIICD